VRLWLRPGLLGLHAFAVLAVGFCIVMGLWQLGVYDTRQDHERLDQRTTAPVELTRVWKPGQVFTDRLDGRRVHVTGEVSAKRVYVTGKALHGDRGAWVLAPVRVDGADASLIVVLGWLRSIPSAGPDERPVGTVAFDAVLQPSEGSGEPFDPKAGTIGAVSIPQLTNVLPERLYSGFAIATSSVMTRAYETVQPPAADVSWTVGLRNLAYAVQWWVFGAFALFMWWRMAGENVAARRAAQTADEESAGSLTP
jgi:surfeit locus 1 family protein